MGTIYKTVGVFNFKHGCNGKNASFNVKWKNKR